MREMDAIRFSSLHLYGITYEWWYNGFTILGHNKVFIFEEFFQRVLDRFEKKDEEEYFRDMATLQQITTMGSYVEEFQRILIMILDVSVKRIAFLFMEVLKEPLKGLVKVFDPPNL